MSSSAVIVPIEDLQMSKSLISVDGMDCHGNRPSPIQKLASAIAMRKLAEALESPLSANGDVILSKLKRVPKMSKLKLKKIIATKYDKLSPFTLEVLDFVANYRGSSVGNFRKNLHGHMRRMIYDHGFAQKNGKIYNVDSIHTLIKKALVYTEL